jgi:CrcB protein
MNIFAVFIGGGLGSVARYIIGMGIGRIPQAMPWGTFLANILATLVLAWLFRALPATEEPGPTAVRLLWMTGFCGGFSTFSTFSLDTVLLYEQWGWPAAAGNVALNVICCVALAAWFVLQRTV